jgi:hypothetical protein
VFIWDHATSQSKSDGGDGGGSGGDNGGGGDDVGGGGGRYISSSVFVANLHTENLPTRNYRRHRSHDMTIRVLRPPPPLVIRQTGITIPGNGGIEVGKRKVQTQDFYFSSPTFVTADV